MGKKFITYFGLFLLAGGINLTAATDMVLADDLKVYPGSYCHTRKSYGQMAQGRYSGGGVSNLNQNQVLRIFCPLIRDYMADDAGISKVEVWFHNPNRRKSISCHVVTHLKHGRTLHSKRSYSRRGLINGSFVLAYGKDAGVWSSYTMTCTLPNSPNGRDPVTIHAFKIREYD